MEVAQKIKSLLRKEYSAIILLMLLVLALHLITINEPAQLMIDENYYVNDARLILAGEGELRGEHPTLGQLLVALGMQTFGDNTLGWRILSVLFGTISIGLFYLICRRLNMSQRTSLLATFLLALENMTFIQASIAMLDAFNVTFMLAAFWLYLRKNYLPCGIAICLATLVKLSGALAIPAIALHWLLIRRDRPVYFSASMILAPLLFLGLLPLFDFAVTGQLTNPIDRALNMVRLTSTVTFAGSDYPYASRPWEWVVLPKIMPYWYHPHYIATTSFTIWALIIPTVIYMAIKAKRGSQAALFGVCWFASTYLIWIPAQLISDRLTYVFYFYPTAGAICIGLGMGLSRLIDVWKSRSGGIRRAAITTFIVYLLLHIATFVILSPFSSPWLKFFNQVPTP